MKIQQFIEKAIEGGYGGHTQYRDKMDKEAWPKQVKIIARGMLKELHKILLDPEAWKAVGKVEGWEAKQHPYWRISLYPEYDGIEKQHPLHVEKRLHVWEARMYGMIDALVEGVSVEQYLETL